MAVIFVLQPGHFMDKHCSWPPAPTPLIGTEVSRNACQALVWQGSCFFCQNLRSSIKRKGCQFCERKKVRIIATECARTRKGDTWSWAVASGSKEGLPYPTNAACIKAKDLQKVALQPIDYKGHAIKC
jgi:hypothetical protein